MTGFVGSQVPSISITQYLKRFSNQGRMEWWVFIYAVAFIDKLTQ